MKALMLTLHVFLLLTLEYADSCLVVLPAEIDMNGCKCPQINYATRKHILQSEFSSHLADRTIKYPESVTVSDNCQVRVTPGTTGLKSFYFMIFRDEAPPIFERRFLSEVPYDSITVESLKCEEVNGQFEWRYHGGLVASMSFALQSNEENCGCQVWKGASLVREEYCDMYTAKCQNQSDVLYFWDHVTIANYWLANQPSAEIVDATCVGRNWYYNGLRLEAYEQTEVWCQQPKSIYNFDPEVVENYCGCKEMRKMDNNYMMIFDGANTFANYSIDTPTLNYASNAPCTPQISCPSGTEYVSFFSRNFKPMLYSPNSPPSIQCQLTPLTVTNEARFWWVDGVMLSDATVACFSKSCPCNYAYLEESNIKSLIGSHPFYRNLSSYPIRSPDDNCVDACPNSIECATGYSLVVLDDTAATLYASGSVSPICTNRKWTVEGTNFNQIYAVCVNFSAPVECECNNTFIGETSYGTFITHPFFQNFSSYPIRAPDDNFGNACPNSIECPSGYSLVVLNSSTSVTYPSGSVSPTCFDKKWTIEGNVFGNIYTVCVNFSAPADCFCNYTYLDSSNVKSLIGSHPSYNEVMSYEIKPPTDNAHDGFCPTHALCPSGYSNMVLDNKSFSVTGLSSFSIFCVTRRWRLDWWWLDEMFAVCINYNAPLKCPCNNTYLDESNIESLIGSHPFYQNISLYPIRSPDDNCDDACPNSIECLSGYSLVVLDETSFISFSPGSVSPSCSNKKWTIDGNNFDQIYAVCVNFSAPAECACDHEYLDASNIASLVGKHPFYQNVTSYPTRSPDDMCDDEKCPNQVDCPVGFTLVVFDASDAKLYSSGSISPSCSLQSNKWTVEGSQLETLYSICVNYSSPVLPCNCSFTYLDETTIFKYPHENVTQYPVRSPEESCADSCPNEVACADGLTLTILEQDGMLVFPSGSINPTCVASSNQWYIEDHLIVHADGLLAVCVNFSAAPQLTCQCEYKFLDETNIASVLGDEHPFYKNATSYPLRAPEDFCDDGGCPAEVACAEGYSVVIFDTNDAKVYSPGPISPKCDPFAKKWGIENDEGIERLYAVCVKFTSQPEKIEMNGCACPQIEWIDQAGIRLLPMAAYLGDRPTFYPANVTVSDQCEVTVDAASSCEYDDFYFMIFSTNIMPVFAKRVFTDAAHPPFTLDPLGLKCALVDGEYQWQYHGGEVKNISFAQQSNEEMCGCGTFPGSTQLETGICDVVQIQCPKATDVAYLYNNASESLKFEYLLPDTQTNTIYEATCQSGSWWYLGTSMGNSASWELHCKSPQSIITTRPTTYNYQCGCRELVQVSAYNGFMELYDPEGLFQEYGMSPSTVTYQNCVPIIGCKKPTDVLVFFGRNVLPDVSFLTYSPTTPPIMTCQPSPQALSVDPNSASLFWFIDGMVLREPAFACLTPP